MRNGAWRVEHGAWSMEHGAWSMEHGAWSIEHGAWSSLLQVFLRASMEEVWGQIDKQGPEP